MADWSGSGIAAQSLSNGGRNGCRREQEEASAGLQKRLAATIIRFSGSMRFVYAHALIYGCWILANLGLVPGIKLWDPTFVVIAMIASVEAIFLSTFILSST
jgi:uncharacterized membrane protein